ncbi:Translation elongation factor P/YeiP, central [Corchorus olitorius]|uniref:Translation elongation factor P/YeiP, central n=1 Tax=Corchorus olitorius TaxID=93759 RepID=A0A1R3IJP0_9ROSI|nr:Translation elongation factor P/YeiP, central [Corchorus olitorius]
MKAFGVGKRLCGSLSFLLKTSAPNPTLPALSPSFLHSLLSSPWSASQQRGAKVNAIHLRPGNVIEKSGRIYQVVESEHKQRGRGGAMMQLELRDVDNGNKVSLRFGTEEPVERVFVEQKSFQCLYTENKTAFLIEPETFDQLQVPLDLFGKSAAYLKEEMKVTLQLFDGRPLSASVPKHVTCIIKETQTPMKGVSATPRYKKALLDNGLTVQVPPYLDVGEEIIISTEDDSYLSRVKFIYVMIVIKLGSSSFECQNHLD